MAKTNRIELVKILNKHSVQYGPIEGDEKRKLVLASEALDAMEELVAKNGQSCSNVPTAEELLKDKTNFGTFGDMYPREKVSEKMIEFAKLHVKAALKAVSEGAWVDHRLDGAHGCDYEIDKESILNAYPLNNVK